MLWYFMQIVSHGMSKSIFWKKKKQNKNNNNMSSAENFNSMQNVKEITCGGSYGVTAICSNDL